MARVRSQKTDDSVPLLPRFDTRGYNSKVGPIGLSLSGLHLDFSIL